MIILFGGPTQKVESPITAAGLPPIITDGQPGPIIGPPTCGTGGSPGVAIGQMVISPRQDAGNPIVLLIYCNYCRLYYNCGLSMYVGCAIAGKDSHGTGRDRIH